MRRLALAALLLTSAACVPALPGATAAGRSAGPGECSGHDHGPGKGKGHEKGHGKGHDRHCGDDQAGGTGGGTGGEGGDGGGGDGGGGGGGGNGAPNTPGAPGTPVAGGPAVAGTPTGGTGAGGAQDVVAPSLSRPTLSATVFRAARRGPAISTPVGTRVRYTLSEPARVRFTVLKARITVRRCAHAHRGAHATRHRRCIRYRRLGRFTHRGAVGANSFRFRGRVKGRRLSPGRYRLVSRAIDAGGNRSRPRRVRFDIVR